MPGRTHSRIASLLWAAGGIAALLASPVAGAQTSGRDSQAPTQLLDRASEVVDGFMGQLSDVECTEQVSQVRLERNDKVEYEETSTFDYVVLAESNGGDLTLAESRLPKQQAKHTRNLPLMVTNGFSTLLLIFHPYYRAGFEFTPLGDDVVDGKSYVKLGFQHIKGLRTTAALLVRGKEYPLDLKGVAWIDPEAGTVLKINAELTAPMDDIGLRSMRSEVQYAPVKFQGTSKVYWLPETAVIEVESPRQHWRNVHRFTAYHQFVTNVKDKVTGQP